MILRPVLLLYMDDILKPWQMNLFLNLFYYFFTISLYIISF